MTVQSRSLTDKLKDDVRAWVPKVREVLEEDLGSQLGRLGIKKNGRPEPLDKMHLSESDQAVRARVEALLQREATAEGATRGYATVRRDITYTFLNRLVGLKSMESRGLLFLPPPNNPNGEPEATEIITPIEGQLRSRYLRDFRAAFGSRYKYQEDAEESLLRDGLTAAFKYITKEIKVLFDPDHEYSCVWPTHAGLTTVIAMINNDLPQDAYRAPDFLGWVYQFFNREEKRRVRDENKGIPRTSYELAVINQFYTPSWVVKVLVDNTLGRLWCQMHPNSSLFPKQPPPLPVERVSDKPVADYLVPRTGERILYARFNEIGQLETFKAAKDITLLDPACGTMHFGQYAFGLFYRMYEEEIEHAGEEGWPERPSVENSSGIATAIVENNLFGIDIDPRAIQIASLSLLLTAKEAALRHGHDPRNVGLTRTNLVIANAVDLGEEHLRALIEKLGPRLGANGIQERLFSALWENLQNVSELGSLIQVRESVSSVLDEWVEKQARTRGLKTIVTAHSKTDQLELGSLRAELLRESARQLELERRLLEEEAEQLQRELLANLEAATAEASADPSQRLFAEDTARGLKLLQVLSRRFDVVVMNPPYGSFVPTVMDFVKAAYPLTKNNIYSTFIERATQLVEPDGYIGALVSSTFVNLKDFEKLREEILLKRNPLIVMLDLGFGILDDATVEATAIVLRGGAK
jgi:hypothetical protein